MISILKPGSTLRLTKAKLHAHKNNEAKYYGIDLFNLT
jgi:hypothetical protein